MKRTLLIPLIVLVLATMACSIGKAATPNAAPAQPTKTVVEAEKATQPPAPAEPTDTEEAAEPQAPVEPTDTEEAAAPTETASGPETFTDSFNQANDSWSDPVVVTSQASGREPFIKVTTGDGTLRFALSDKETYVYKFFLDELEDATTVEADFQNKGAVNTGIAIVCKANDDYTSWYEVRVSAADYNYYFYQYDKKRKEVEGKNPYVQLDKGHMKVDEYFAAKPNHIVFTCTDNGLALDVNNGKKTASYTLDNPLEGTIFGLGVMSADVIPTTVDYETVTIR